MERLDSAADPYRETLLHDQFGRVEILYRDDVHNDVYNDVHNDVYNAVHNDVHNDALNDVHNAVG